MRESAPNNAPTKNASKLKAAMWTAIITSFSYFAFLVFYIFSFYSGEVFIGATKLFSALTVGALVSSIISIVLIRKGMLLQGTLLVFISNLITPTLGAIAIKDISLLTSPYIFVFSVFIYFWVIPEEKRAWIVWGATISLFVSTVADLANPSFQADAGGAGRLAPYTLAVVSFAFVALLVWRVWQARIRPKFLFVFVIATFLPFLQTGRSLSILKEKIDSSEYQKLDYIYKSTLAEFSYLILDPNLLQDLNAKPESFEYELIYDYNARQKADFQMWLLSSSGIELDAHPNNAIMPIEELEYCCSSSSASISVPVETYQNVFNNGIEEKLITKINSEEVTLGVFPVYQTDGDITGIIEIWTSRTEPLGAFAEDRFSILGLTGLLSLSGLILFSLFANYVVLKPVKHITEIAMQQINGILSARVTQIPPDELGILGENFNTLTEQLENQINLQQKMIVERTRALEEHSAYLESSAEVSRKIASITNPQELVLEVVTQIQDAFDLYYVGLFLVDDINEWAILEAGTGTAGKTMLADNHRLKIGKGMIGWCIKNAKARIALDVGEDAVRFENPVLPATRSEGALPLRSRDRVLGALTIQSVEAEAFTPEIIATLQTMADQIGIALDNAELLTRSEKALRAERRAYGNLSREDWLALLLRKNIPTYVSRKEGEAEFIDEDRKIIDIANRQKLDEDKLTATIPIKVEGQILGCVKLRKTKEQGVWTQKELELAGVLVGNSLGVALESARLFEQTQRRAAQERVIGESTARIRETLDIESVLETAAQELHKILGKVETEVWIDAE